MTTQSAPRTIASGSWPMVIWPFDFSAHASTSAGGLSSGGQATRSSKSNCTAAWIQLVAMLLPSPDQAIALPWMAPRCSSKVITSAISWQGCVLSVRPLITGTVAYLAISRSFSSTVVRIMMMST